MKYLKLFEAFDSQILSKTVGFLKNSESKKEFFSQLFKICDTIKFPKSELKDEFFSYLAFTPAIKANTIIGDEPCEALSRNAFPEYGVEGEKCKEGKVMRKWGARTRSVACPICGGTGVKKRKSEVKLIKFWFSADGKYVSTTAVDGQIREVSRVSKVSKSIADYDITGTTDDSQELQTGQIVRVRINGRQTICYILKDPGGSRYPFAIQDEHSGSGPDNIASSTWNRFGRYSWHLSRGEYRSPIEILSPKYKDEEDGKEEVDPYSWNVSLSTSRYSSGLQVDQYKDLKEVLKDAHFAIVMDFGKIKQSGFKTTYQISTERQESREGALALQTPEDIKSANIERYIQTLANKIAEGDELSKITKIIPKILGGNNSIFYLFRGRNLSTVDSLSTRLFRFMTDEHDKDYHAREIVSTIKNTFKQNLHFASDLNNCLDFVRKELQKNNKTEYLKLFNELMRVSQKINTNLLQSKMESIDDIEFVYQKLYSINRMLNSSRNPANELRYFFERLDYLSSERSYQRLIEVSEEDIPAIMNGLKTIEKFVER
jgi:hypothetical protein